MHFGTLFIRLISPFYLLITINQVLSGALRGAGDARNCMLIMLGSFVAFRQIYLYAVSKLWDSIIPIAFGYPVGWVLCSILLIIYYKKGKWQTVLSGR